MVLIEVSFRDPVQSYAARIFLSLGGDLASLDHGYISTAISEKPKK